VLISSLVTVVSEAVSEADNFELWQNLKNSIFSCPKMFSCF